MASQMRYIVVDEFDNVVGYATNRQDALAEAAAENENGERAVYAYRIALVGGYDENGKPIARPSGQR